MPEPEDALPRGEFTAIFNGAMDSIRRELGQQGKELTLIRGIFEAQAKDKIAEAEARGIAKAHLEELSKRMDVTANRFWYIAIGLVGQFLWSFFGAKVPR